MCDRRSTDVPRTSLKRPIISSPGRPATGSLGCFVDMPAQNFRVFVLPVKIRKSNKRSSCNKGAIAFVLISKSPLKIPCRFRTLESLRDLQGTSPEGRVLPELLHSSFCFLNFNQYFFFLQDTMIIISYNKTGRIFFSTELVLSSKLFLIFLYINKKIIYFLVFLRNVFFR